MVHGKKPYEHSNRRVIREYGSYSVPPIVDVSGDELEVDAQRTVDSYLLHHIESDRVIHGRETNISFD